MEIDIAGLRISAKGQGLAADAEGFEENIQRRVYVGLVSAHPDMDIGARTELLPAKGKVDLPDPEPATRRKPPLPYSHMLPWRAGLRFPP